ncbi:hypothetical protein A7K73_05670 [Candidatus Methylacidiphilum fumarolicum]|nr:hypothetical protein A7K73_05670 [Candidatus Methylacidiphilum fumarolicum]TFE77190.1 hypothetical protein A7D33_06405 [Candidatus Methylacidiphilum fumarolicum]
MFLGINRHLPFFLLLFNINRPPLVFERFKNPYCLFLVLFEGWYVLFIRSFPFYKLKINKL